MPISLVHTAIVILNWNGKAFLEAFLSPLLACITATPEVEVVIADNNSTDGSVDFLRTHHPQLRLILFDQNWGYAGGYNRALQQIEARYYILLNSDIEVTPDWLPPLIAFMDTTPQAGICMPKIRSTTQRDHFEYAGACGGFIDRYGYPFCRGRILSRIEQDCGQYDAPMEVFWASGACLMIRATLFHELGGFDDRFFAHMEEIDLCWRAKLKGHQAWVVPQSIVFHVGGGTLPNDSPYKCYLNHRNNLWMLYKNLPKKKRFPILAARITLDHLSALIYLIQGKPALSAAVWRAHRHFWNGRKEVSRQIVENASQNAMNHTKKTIWSKSIVWHFFIHRKRRTFDRLNIE